MKAFKYRIYPNKSQIDLLERTFGSTRKVWNTLLAANKEQYEFYRKSGKVADRPKVSLSTLSANLTDLKANPDFLYLTEVSSIALQQKVKDLSEAFSTSFKQIGKGLPDFKSKHKSRNSFRIVGSIRIKGKKLFMPKSETGIKVRFTRALPSMPSSYTISRTPDGKYWVSFLCKEYDPALTSGEGVVGIDLGLKDLIVDSNGNHYTNPKHYHKSQERLARRQRKLARCSKGSNRRKKAKLRVAICHAKIANQRNDHLHKLTRQLVNDNQVIGVESLNVKGMASNRRLAKSVMDAGFGAFLRLLTYKASESHWTTVVAMSPWYPSTQTCSACGYRLTGEDKLKLSTRAWTCPNCGSEHDRDENAATNIRNVSINLVERHERPRGVVLYADSLRDLTSKTTGGTGARSTDIPR